MHIRTQLIAHMQALDIFHGAPETQPSLLFIYTCIATHMYVYIYINIYVAKDRAFNSISCGGLRCAQTRPINSAQDYVHTYVRRACAPEKSPDHMLNLRTERTRQISTHSSLIPTPRSNLSTTPCAADHHVYMLDPG